MKKMNSISARLSTSIGTDNRQDSKWLSLQGQSNLLPRSAQTEKEWRLTGLLRWLFYFNRYAHGVAQLV